ncbi:MULTISPECIES: BrnT family toxin [unclassified Mesorhizobium]|uniref:BrnT family toxin n=1 Tax=unclassified Mesorhizobium TaxID=325217 RepID=UPI001129EDB5|nr:MULTISPECIES: BrnT family toxin [unclassified Mesorhizobium]MBZ9897541.1 BrnT family toxin [Mesorhizobium sp. BR1-1-6]TPI52834.1 BrnT family toxin [Mesorhizobium sp. B3-1-1]TPJ70860.1 BrnT family toxin [Mesorhizobium sp. B2-6-7]TPJ85955.1 BrnT family toxin [Mesorhizobium sp. B2-6-3]TPJ99823.1 BrnT family toxin [Mesorhizobium sp. B2-5-10]
MLFEWDENKAKTNRAKHGVDFAIAPSFDFANAVIRLDDSEDFGEDRLVAIGLIEAGVYVMVYVERSHAIRVISLRKATRQEITDYVENL